MAVLIGTEESLNAGAIFSERSLDLPRVRRYFDYWSKVDMRSSASVRSINSLERRETSLEEITEQEVIESARVVGELVSPTPLFTIDLSFIRSDFQCLVKMENLTQTGSFKIRGASHFIACLSKEPGFEDIKIATASTGNHGIGLAWACRRFGKSVTVVVPEGVPLLKREKLEQFGARVQISGKTLDEAMRSARQEYGRAGCMFVPSFDPRVILGHSTMGTELFKSGRKIDHIYFPLGVGSGMAGLSLACQTFAPSVRLVGVVPTACDAWARSFNAGKVIASNPKITSAGGLRTARPDADIFNFLRTKIERVITVSEDDIAQALDLVSTQLKFTEDGTGVVGLAGLIKENMTVSSGGSLATFICG